MKTGLQSGYRAADAFWQQLQRQGGAHDCPHLNARGCCAAHRPHIGFGHVRHTRLRPRRHRFIVPHVFSAAAHAHAARATRSGRRAGAAARALAFRDADHGDGRSPEQGGALAWLEALLHSEGIDGVDGEIWLHCYPRVLGYSFKPVSFRYRHRADGMRAIVAEVNNTFGERHADLLDAPQYGQELRAQGVSTCRRFARWRAAYRFEFKRGGAQGLQSTRVRIDFDDAQGPLVLTGVAGRLQPLDAASRRRALWHYPLLTLGVIAPHPLARAAAVGQARPLHRKPAPPAQPVTRFGPSTSATPSMPPPPLHAEPLTMNTTTASPSALSLPANMPAAARQGLRLLQRLQHGTLHLELPDGQVLQLGSGQHPHASMRLHNWQVFGAVLRSGDIGLAEGYIAQDWSTPTWPTCCAC